MPALALGCGLGLGNAGSVLTQMLALTPEALWLAGFGETLSGAYVSSWADMSGKGHTIAQANANYQPTSFSGYIRFYRTRNDHLYSASVLPLGTGNYTLAVVNRYASLPGTGEFQATFTNGTAYSSGQQLLAQNPPGLIEAMYHWAGASALANASPDTTKRSRILRWNGTNLLARISGVDQTPVALAAPTTPSGNLIIGAGSLTPTWGFDGEVSMLAVFTRSLSTVETDALSAIIQANFGIP